MAKTAAKKRGPKDRSYVNKKEEHEVNYAPKRKSPAKQFGKKEKQKIVATSWLLGSLLKNNFNSHASGWMRDYSFL